jgi:hypothetical protein
MGKSWRDNYKKANARGGGNFFRYTKGRAVLDDLKMIDGYEDEFTFVASFIVKSSEPLGDEPAHKPGEKVDVVCQLVKFEASAADMKGILYALAPELQGHKDEEGETAKILRLADKDDAAAGWKRDRTVPGAGACPLRGVEVSYSTRKKTTKKGTVLTVPTFAAVPQTDAEIDANAEWLKTV